MCHLRHRWRISIAPKCGLIARWMLILSHARPTSCTCWGVCRDGYKFRLSKWGQSVYTYIQSDDNITKQGNSEDAKTRGAYGIGILAVYVMCKKPKIKVFSIWWGLTQNPLCACTVFYTHSHKPRFELAGDGVCGPRMLGCVWVCVCVWGGCLCVLRWAELKPVRTGFK